MLFRLFSVNYKELWTKTLETPELRQASTFLWMKSLENYEEKIIIDSAMEAIKNYQFPPSISQILEIIQTKLRNKRMEGTENAKTEYHTSAPLSPLLAEYMANNPRKPDDPFKILFEKYQGQELGREVIKEIKKQLANKNVKQYGFVQNTRNNEPHKLIV